VLNLADAPDTVRFLGSAVLGACATAAAAGRVDCWPFPAPAGCAPVCALEWAACATQAEVYFHGEPYSLNITTRGNDVLLVEAVHTDSLAAWRGEFAAKCASACCANSVGGVASTQQNAACPSTFIGCATTNYGTQASRWPPLCLALLVHRCGGHHIAHGVVQALCCFCTNAACSCIQCFTCSLPGPAHTRRPGAVACCARKGRAHRTILRDGQRSSRRQQQQQQALPHPHVCFRI
jgi:hypothetical protein